MVCEVKIIEDSKNPITGTRLTTFQLKYWRSIHAEVLTHHYSTRYETKNEISEASRNLKQGVTTYQGSANAMGIP
jgi:hypothetical protein